MSEPLFFHVDLDAFFASVEMLDHPEYIGKPLIIGKPGPRSVASTCSYEARKYGVHSAMPMVTALKLCPHAICVWGNMKRYREKSKEIMTILKEFAPGFQQASIDEAYLDMSGTERLYGSAGKAALTLKKRVRESTGLTISIGIAPSRFLAKLASDYHKPDGITLVKKGEEERFIDAVGLKKLWGVGKSTLAELEKRNIRDTETLRSLPLSYLERNFGNATGAYLYKVVRGVDPGIYSGENKTHSISTESTFYPDLYGKEAIDTFILEMSEEIIFRSLDEHFMARTVGVKIRYGDFTTVSIQTTPTEGIYSSQDVYRIAKELFWKKYNGQGIRLLGVGLYQMYEGDNPEQGELFAKESEKQRALEKTILRIREKGVKISRASTLKPSTERKEENHN